MPTLDDALSAFDGNDVSLAAALAHVLGDLPRERMLADRVAPTPRGVAQARAIAFGAGSAMLVEAFVASPLDAMGDHAAALDARLDALPLCPRWESWMACTLLTRLASCLVRAGRSADAGRVAERALRFLPADPDALCALAAADPARSAQITGYFRDNAFVSPCVVGPAREDEREAQAWSPNLDTLEPLSDAELARYLVYDRCDVVLTETPTEARRHAATLLRRGDPGGALLALQITAEWASDNNPARAWLDLDGHCANGYFAARALRAAIESSAGIAAVRALGKKEGARFQFARATREAAAADLASRGDIAGAEPLLADWLLSVRRVARAGIPTSPLLARIEKEEQAATDILSMRVFALRNPDGTEYGATHPSHVTFVRDGKAIDYPFPPSTGGQRPRFPSYLDLAPNARSMCKVCKARIDLGAWRLVVSGGGDPGEMFAHLGCGLERRFAAGLADVLERDRRALPNREELERALSAPKKGKRPKPGAPAP